MSHGMSNIPTFRQGRSYHIGNKEGSACMSYCLLFVFAAVSVGVNCYLITSLRGQLSLLSSFQEIKGNILELPIGNAGSITGLPSDSVVHFATDKIKASVVEPDFNLNVNSALSLKRYTEYCQWNELAHDTCETCHRTVRQEDGSSKQESYSCNCVRTYSYVKHWQGHRTNSLLFNQPASHFNPQRDPYPSTTFYSIDPVIEESIRLEPGLVERVKGKSEYLSFGNARGRLPEELLTMYDSKAFLQQHFVYAGNGYFFSPYEVSTQERLAKMFFQWFEGSLLDFQIGDLIPSCTAGDIRVSYYAIRPKQVSGLGKISVRNAGTSSIGLYTTPKLAIVGLLREGLLSATQLMDAEAWDFKKYVYLSRLLLFVWAFFPARLVKAYAGCLVSTSWTIYAANALAIAGMINFGVQFLMAYSIANEVGYTSSDLFSLVIGFVVSFGIFIASTLEWKKNGDVRYGGLGPVKRLLYRYSGAPVSWYEAPYRKDL